MAKAVSKYKPKAIDKLEMQLDNRLSSSTGLIRFPGVDGEVFAATCDRSNDEFLPHLAIDLNVSGLKLSVLIDEKLTKVLITDSVTRENFVELPLELQTAVVEHSLRKILTHIENKIERSVTVSAVCTKSIDLLTEQDRIIELTDKNNYRNPIAIRINNETRPLMLFVIKALLPNTPDSEHSFLNEHLHDIPVSTWFEMGTLTLTDTEISTLTPGDILLPVWSLGNHSIPLICRVGGELKAQATMSEGIVTIESELQFDPEATMTDTEGQENPLSQFTPKESDKTDENSITNSLNLGLNPGDDDGMDGIDMPFTETPEHADIVGDLNITLTFDIGRKQLPLKELYRITPGYTFELDRSEYQPIDLRANGRVIGTCELVRINNKLGARIVELKGGNTQ